MLYKAWALIIPLGLLSTAAFLQIAELQVLTQNNSAFSKTELLRQENNQLLELSLIKQLPRFGFSNLTADWTFLNFLQYFGDSDVRDVIGYRLSTNFFEVIVDSDPRFFAPYIYLTNSVSLYAGQPEKSVALMDQGLQSMKPMLPQDSYFVWRYKGTDELLFLGDTDQAKASYRTAEDWAKQVGSPEALSVAEVSQQTANFLAKDPSSRPAQINAWMQVFIRAVDDTVRELAASQIESLGGTILFGESGRVTVRYNVNDDASSN